RDGAVDGGVPRRHAARACGPVPARRRAAGAVRVAGRLPPAPRRPVAGGPQLQHPVDRVRSEVGAMGLGAYFRELLEAGRTSGEGMAVTFSHLLRKPYTIQYPDRLPDGVRVQDTLPFRYRGILEVDLEICTACLACERACPIDCIVIDAQKD